MLQVLCSSLESAHKVNTAAFQSGFGESGISSISTDNLRTSTAMVAVRTTSLAFDSVIGYEDGDGKLIPMVTEAYMRVLVELCNERFRLNKERTEAFREALFASFGPQQSQYSGPCAWEPIEQRRARMKEDGIRRRAETDAQRTVDE
jgi:tRNA wybutosine-synthesizing protein 3